MSAGMGSAERAASFQERMIAYEAGRGKSGRGSPSAPGGKRELIGILGLLKYPLAMVVGAGSMLAVRILAFHLPEQFGAITPYLGERIAVAQDLLLTLPLFMLLAWLVRLQGKQYVWAICALGVMYWFEEDLLLRYPDIWVNFYSPEYIQDQRMADVMGYTF